MGKTDKGLPTQTIELMGKSYRIRYDFDAMLEIETHLQAISMGFPFRNFWQLLDPPYSAKELLVMILSGINGARRDSEEKELLSLADVKQLLEKHLKNKMRGLEGWTKAQQDLWIPISTAARLAVGYDPNLNQKEREVAETERESRSAMMPSFDMESLSASSPEKSED